MSTQILDHLVRPATLDDFEAVLDLVTRLNVVDYDEPMISADALRRVWQSPTFNLATDTWLATTPDGHLAG